jgi:hypothetical protein
MLGGPGIERIGQIAIPVVDLERAVAAHAALVERGVIFVQAPQPIARLPDHELWLATCRDSEDNVLALMSEVRLSP